MNNLRLKLEIPSVALTFNKAPNGTILVKYLFGRPVIPPILIQLDCNLGLDRIDKTVVLGTKNDKKGQANQFFEKGAIMGIDPSPQWRTLKLAKIKNAYQHYKEHLYFSKTAKFQLFRYKVS